MSLQNSNSSLSWVASVLVSLNSFLLNVCSAPSRMSCVACRRTSWTNSLRASSGPCVVLLKLRALKPHRKLVLMFCKILSRRVYTTRIWKWVSLPLTTPFSVVKWVRLHRALLSLPRRVNAEPSTMNSRQSRINSVYRTSWISSKPSRQSAPKTRCRPSGFLIHPFLLSQHRLHR